MAKTNIGGNVTEKHSSGTTIKTTSTIRVGLLRRATAVLASAAMIAGALNFAVPAVDAGAATFSGITKIDSSQLYIFNTGGAATVGGWVNPDSIAAANFQSQRATLVTPNGTANGAACTGIGGARDTGAVGPIYLQDGDEHLYLLVWGGASAVPTICAIRDDGVGRSTGALTSTGGDTWGGEVNQTTGELYVKRGGPTTNINGNDNTSTSTHYSIHRLNLAGGTTLLARSTGIKAKPSATNLAEAAAAHGINGLTGNWEVASDMTIDAKGNIFTVAQNGARHAVVKITVPRDTNINPITGLGNPVQGVWEYEVVSWLGSLSNAGDIYGLAFMNGQLYLLYIGGPMLRINPLTEKVESLGSSGARYDLGSSQVAPVAEGTIFNDLNANGVRDASELGVGGVTVEIWAATTVGMQLQGSVTTAEDGSYSALLPVSKGDVYLRLAQPTIAGANARQTYGSGGTFTNAIGSESNTVTPLCYVGGTDYTPLTGGGACDGARKDGIDPSVIGTVSGGVNLGNPIAAVGGAATVTKVAMQSASAIIAADFGITTAASWGDNPPKSTNADGGPYNYPGYHADTLFLGAKYPGDGANPLYPDGVAGVPANAHAATDDGLEVSPAGQNAWVSAQGGLFAVGEQYDFRLKVAGTEFEKYAVSAPDSRTPFVGVWITPLSGGVATTSYSTVILSGAPDTLGYVQGTFTVPTTAPTGGVQQVYIRARVGLEQAKVTPDARGVASPGTTAWVPLGEVEDYAAGIASNVIRLQARTLGSASSRFNVNTSNISGTPPSSATDSLLTTNTGSWQPSTNRHAVINSAADATFATVGAGAAGSTNMNGWEVSTRKNGAGVDIDTYCYNSTTNDLVDYVVTGNNVTVKASSLTATNRDITCKITYRPVINQATSGVRVRPTTDQIINSGAYTVQVLGLSTVSDENGVVQTVPAEGHVATLTLAPQAGGASATGAAFYEGVTPRGQVFGCTLDDNGECTVTVKGSVAGTYTLAVGKDANSNSVIDTGEHFAGFPTSATGTDSAGNPVTEYAGSPLSLRFKAGDPSQGTIELDNSVTRYADAGLTANATVEAAARAAGYGKYIDTDALPGADYHILYINLADAAGAPIEDMQDGASNSGKIHLACGSVSPSGAQCDAYGISFGAIDATGTPGRYQVKVYSETAANARRISVTVDSITTGALPNKDAASNRYVTATFLAMSVVDLTKSSLTIACDGSEVASYVSNTNPGDYCVGTVVLKDFNGSGITGVESYLTPGAQNAAQAGDLFFRNLAADTATDSDGQLLNPGQYTFNIHADLAGSYPIKVTYSRGADTATINGTPNAVFAEPAVDLTKTTHTLTNTANKYANTADFYTGTITLQGANGAPVRDGETKLSFDVTPSTGYTIQNLACVQDAGKCTGVYTYTIKAAQKGTYEITPVYGTGVTAKTLTMRDATFIVDPTRPHADSSVFVLGSSTIVEVPAGQPVDVTAATPAQAIAQTVSVDKPAGYTFHINVAVWDDGQVNLIPGATVKAVLSGASCDATFDGSGGTSTQATSGAGGTAAFTVTSPVASSCTITVRVVSSGSDVTVAGGVKTLNWVDSAVATATYTVTPATAGAAIVADNIETGTITVTLKDSATLAVTNQASNLSGVPQTGSRITVGAFTHTGSGVYTATWTGKKAGTFDLGVSLSGGPTVIVQTGGNGKAFLKPGQPEITGPFDCDPADADSHGTNISTTSPALKVGESAPVVVLVTDAYCNPVTTPVNVNFATTGGTLSATTQSTNAAGQAPVTLTDSTARTDNVSATVGGVTVKTLAGGTSVAITFNADIPDPASSVLTAVTTGSKTVLTETHTARVTVRDGSAAHNPLAGQSVTFSASWTKADGTAGTATFTGTTDASGQVDWTFTQPDATIRTVTAAITAGQIPPVPGVQFQFVAGPPDVTKTLASFTVGAETVKADGVATVPASMKVQDANGNPIAGQSCSFDVSYTGDGAVFPGGVKSITRGPTLADGICATTLTSYYPGSFPVTGTYSGATAPSQDAKFNNQAIDPGKSSWRVDPTAGNSKNPAVADNLDSYTVTINLRDAADAPINAESVTIGYALTPGGVEQTMVVTSVAPNGIATGQIKTTVAGVYNVRVFKGSDTISTTPGGSVLSVPVTFQAGDPDVTKTAATWITSTGKVLNDNSSTHYARVTVKDQYDNVVSGASVTFTLDTTKSAHFTGGALGQSRTEVSGINGEVTVYVASSAAEITTINAALAGAGVGTAALEFGPGAADATKSAFTITPASPTTRTADGSASFEGVVTVNDGAGIAVGGYTVAFDVPANVHLVETAPYVTNAAGQVTVHFTSTVAGEYTVNALIGSDKVPTVDQKIKFVAGPASLTVSTFDVSTGKVAADGVATHSATAVVKDGNGNPVSGVTVAFSIEQGSLTISGPALSSGSGTPGATATAVTDVNGVAVVTIRSNEPGTFAATATIGGATINGYANALNNRDAQFTSGNPDPAFSSRTVIPDTDVNASASVAANGSDSFAITVTIQSNMGIKVENATVRITGLDSAVTLAEGLGTSGGLLTGLPTSGNYGTFTWHATSTTAASFTAQVQVMVEGIWYNVGSLVKLNYSALAPDASKSWIVEPLHTATATADGVQTLPVSVYVFDQYENAVPTGSVTFTIPAGTSSGTVTGPNIVVAPISGGVATIDVRATVAAAHEITASVGGTAITTVKQAPGKADPAIHTDGKAHVTFVAGPPDLSSSLLTVPTAAGGATKLANGIETHTAQVVVRDANGNLATSGTVTFQYSYTDFAGVVHTGSSTPRTIGATTGTATWDFSSTVAKVWTITATLGGVTGFVNPATGVQAGFHAGSVDPTRTAASLEVGANAKADGVAFVAAWMTVQDANGNPIPNQYCGFELTNTTNPGAAKFDNAVTGSFTKPNVGPTGADGKCTVEIRSIYEGAFPVKGIFGTAQTPAPLPVAIFNNVPVNPDNSFWSVTPRPGNSTTPATANDTDAYIVTVNLKDAAGAIVNNSSVDVYYKLTPSGAEQILTVVSGASGNPAGTATASIHTTTAGIYDVYVKVGFDSIAKTVGGSVFTEQVEFIPGVANGIESSLTSAPGTAKANGVETLSVSATVKDINGNLIKNTPVVFALPVDVKSGSTNGPGTVTVNTNTAGVATLPLTSVKPGTYNITATVGGVAIVTGSPATATFVNDDLSLTGSLLELATSGLKTVSTEFHTVRATLLDAQGNVFTPGRTVTFYVQAPGAPTWEPLPLGTANTVAGVAEYTFTESIAGTWRVRAAVTAGGTLTGNIGAGASGTIVDAQFKPGDPDPTRTSTTWTVSTGKVLNNNTDTHSAELVVLDAHNNPVPNVSVSFALDATKAAHFTSSTGAGDLGKGPSGLTSDADGKIKVYIASSADETTTITATLGSTTVGTGSFEFGPGAPSVTNSQFVVTPVAPTTRTADGTAYFEGVVTVRDGANIAVGGHTVSFSVPTNVTIAPAPGGSYVTNAAGQVTVRFTSTVAGEYIVNALIGTAKIPTADQTIKFVSGPIDWTKATLTTTEDGATANGTATNKVRATLVDANNNPVTDGFVNFTLPAGVTAVGSGTTGLTTDTNGQVELSVTSTVAATYAITATASKTTTAGPSAIGSTNVTFVPGAPVSGTSVLTVSGSSPKIADGVENYVATIELKDATGNTVTTAGAAVHFTFSLPGQADVEVDAVTLADGKASVPFSTTHAGTWNVAGYYGGAEVTGSPKTLLFVAGPVSTSVSTFDVTGGQVQADGTASHRAWVVATDKDGNPISGVSVTFTIATGASGVPGPVLGATAGTPGTTADVTVVTGADGVAEVFITSYEPGTFAVTAKIGTVSVTGNAVTPLNRDAQFSSGDPDPALSYRSVIPDTDATPATTILANGTESYAITTTIVSAFGTRVENATVRITGLDPAVTVAEGLGTLGGLITGLPTSGNYGTFTWHATSTKSGNFTAQVQVRIGATWHDVGLPVTLNFHANPPATQCEPGVTACTSYTVTPLTQEVGADVAVSVLVTDKYGNPVAGTRVTLESAPGGVFTITSTAKDADGNPITDATGHVSATLTDKVAQVDNVRAKIGGPGSAVYAPTEATALLPVAGQVTSVAVTFTPGVPTVGPFDCLPGKSGTSFNFNPRVEVPINTSSVGTVKVTDAFCNPIQGANVTFSTSGGTFNPPSGSVFTTAAGTVTIALTDTVERVDTVTAMVGGLHIAVTGTEVIGATPVTSQNIEFMDPFGDTTPPTAPVVDPTNGTEITGSAEPSATVEVVDATGKPVPGCEAVTVGADGRFACNPNPVLKDGVEVKVTATDPAGNVSAPTVVTVGAIGITMSPAKAYRGDTIIMRGFNFISGEKVTVVCNSVAVTLGTFTAGTNGQVIVPNWVVPADFEIGQHVCTFTGDKSGPVSAPFQILEPVVVTTGGSTSTPASTVVVASGLPVAVLPKRKLV